MYHSNVALIKPVRCKYDSGATHAYSAECIGRVAGAMVGTAGLSFFAKAALKAAFGLALGPLGWIILAGETIAAGINTAREVC